MKRGLGRKGFSVLAGLLVAAGGAGSAVAGLVTQGVRADGPAVAISHEAWAVAPGFGAPRVMAAPLASLGVFQADTSRPVETAWEGSGPSVGLAPAPAQQVVMPMSLSFPELAAARAKALAAGAGSGLPDEMTGRPSDDFSYLGLGPKMFALLRSGRPAGGLEQWSHSSETSLAYVQPYRQLEFVVKFFGEPKAGSGDSMSEAPVGSEEQLVDNLHVDVDSLNMTLRSQEYGRINTRPEHKEPPSGRMVAIGLEMGLLPAVVGNLGLNSEVIIGRSSNPGFYVGLATNVGFPAERGSDRGDRDVDYKPPYDFSSSAGAGGGMNFGAGDVSGTGPLGGGTGGTAGGTPVTPITPITPTPEPGTLLLVAMGGAWLAARRRAGK